MNKPLPPKQLCLLKVFSLIQLVAILNCSTITARRRPGKRQNAFGTCRTLIPFLTGIRERYGVPLGLVHDMGRGILAGVAAGFPGVADYICHFHFLRDIGKDLLEKEYNDLRNGLKKHRFRVLLRQKLKAVGQKSEGNTVKMGSLLDEGGSGAPLAEWVPMELCRTLIHWILDYPSQLAGYGFPFDRPHQALHQRLEIACRLLQGTPKVIEGRAGQPLRGCSGYWRQQPAMAS